MAIDYEAEEGDCIGNLAFNNGFNWTTLWNHPQNADLKAKRKDPNLLLAGDVVHIPDLQVKQVPGATEQRHKFKLINVPAKLQVQLLEEDKKNGQTAPQSTGSDAQHEDPDFQPQTRKHKPRAKVPYILDIDGVLTKGQSDGNGFVKRPLSPGAQTGRLILFPGTPKEEVYPLQLGGMDPLDEIAGMKKRLSNLGFACDTGGDLTPAFSAALTLFQERAGLPITGKPDDATRKGLKQMHGS
jgi:hypothetical protein